MSGTSQIKYKQVIRPAKLTFWDKAIFAITRPPKVVYNLENLQQKPKPNTIIYKKQSKKVKHFDERIDVTIFIPPNKSKDSLNLIIYCHCNASNRLQAMLYLDKLPPNYAIAGFDFLGCGNTRQYYLSLGYRQSKQIQSIYKSFEGEYKNIILWGRSMGAASVIKYGKGLINVCDSPFSSLKQLTKQSAYKTPKIPNCLIWCFFPCVYCKLRADIGQTAQFDIQDLDLVKQVQKMGSNQSIIFIASKEDRLVNSEHSKILMNNFKGKNKKLFEVTGDHNTPRTKQLIQKVFDQIQYYLKIRSNSQIAQTSQVIKIN